MPSPRYIRPTTSNNLAASEMLLEKKGSSNTYTHGCEELQNSRVRYRQVLEREVVPGKTNEPIQ